MIIQVLHGLGPKSEDCNLFHTKTSASKRSASNFDNCWNEAVLNLDWYNRKQF